MDGVNELTPSRASIGAWTVDRYVHLLRWPLVGGMIAIVLVLAWWANTGIVTGLTAGIALFVGLQVGRRGGRRVESLTAGCIAGFVLGLISAIKKFIAAPELLWAINIISEVLLAAVAGALLSLAGSILYNQIRRS
jgi:hypothetical protein